jgi:hypothetical protein
LSDLLGNLLVGQELSVKPFSLLSTNRVPYTVVLEEDLLALKYIARSAGLQLRSRLEWFPMENLYVCTKCFGLTSNGQGMQRCSCEEFKKYPGVDCPSGYHLCYICASSIAGGTGRYSWNVCAVCLKFGRKLAAERAIRIPLGRHSIMNGLAIPLSSNNDEQNSAINQLIRSLEIATDLAEWGPLQARALFESIPLWKKKKLISVNDWEAKFHLTTVRATSRSVTAFKKYLKVESF